MAAEADRHLDHPRLRSRDELALREVLQVRDGMEPASCTHMYKPLLFPSFALVALVACAEPADGDTVADQDQDLTSSTSFTCTTRWHDDAFADGFKLTVGNTTARMVDLATVKPKKPYAGNFDPSYRPSAGTPYAGHVRYRFSPRLEDFAEASAMDLIVLPTMKDGDAAYLRFQGPEGGATETYTCVR